jgi:hypothetical protein
MNVSKTRLAIGTSLMALTFGMLGGGTAYAFQEHMFNARNDLQQAVNELNQAEHDKGGHREASRVGATSNQPSQSRYSGWWGHALATEVTAPVRRGAHSSPPQLLLRRSSDAADVHFSSTDNCAPSGSCSARATGPDVVPPIVLMLGSNKPRRPMISRT